MNISITTNVLIMQRRRCYVNIPMNIPIIANVTTIQRRIFNANTSKGYIHHDECSHHATRYELFF